jgi:hypothetical protein
MKKEEEQESVSCLLEVARYHHRCSRIPSDAEAGDNYLFSSHPPKNHTDTTKSTERHLRSSGSCFVIGVQ